MNVIRALSELPVIRGKFCLAIGFFDGVHLGHQQILRQAINDARQHEASALAITFDQHPNTVVAPERVPLLIYSLQHKLRTITELGVDNLWLVHFDKPFSEQTGEAFIRGLMKDLGSLRSICVGANFEFGYKRGGNVALLRQLGEELKFTVHGLAAVSLDGMPVSSTRIREGIQAGRLDEVSQMLGRAYSLVSPVVRGDGIGRELGFPTANLDIRGLALPPRGVYAVRAEFAGTAWRAVLNLGFRPTLQNPKPQLQAEAHLLDFQGDLYGRDLELKIVDYLRPEQQFASLTELRAQIALDIEQARLRF
jgi:riboflavin kinase/FMN adenylyltransferase